MSRFTVSTPSIRQPRQQRTSRPRLHSTLAILIALTLAILSALAPAAATPSQAASSAINSVNAYRALANLPPVTEDPTFSNGDFLHSKYMVLNNYYMHDENKPNPVFAPTAEGIAAAPGNTYNEQPPSAASDLNSIDWWMSAPFHQVAVLDPKLQTSGFGSFNDGTNFGAVLDVHRGRTGAGSWPVMYPANGMTTQLRGFKGNEHPDPFASGPCAGYTASWQAPSGAAISLQLSGAPSVTAQSLKLAGAEVEHCWMDESTQPELAFHHAVILMPRKPLADGTYSVSITSNGTVYAWTFNVGTPPPPPTQRTLTVSKAGTGAGTVTGTGIACGADCTETYNDGTSVTLTASPAAGSTFGGWSGSCTGTIATCTLAMNANKTATATFNTTPPPPPTQRTLTVTRGGTGSGTVTATGISCGADCTENYNDGTSVTLTASPAAGSTFGGWSGSCTGTTATCAVTINANKSATATFTATTTPPPAGAFKSTATVTQANVAPGGTVGITATVTTPPAGTYVVDIEVHDANDQQVFQWYWEDQPFTAGQTRTFTTSWPVPANLPSGSYKVQVGVFSGPEWATQHVYNDSAAQVTVGAATPAASCSPRPQIKVVTARGSQANQLQVTVTAGQGTLQQIRFGAATNARISVPAGTGGRAALTNSAGNATLNLTDHLQTLTITVSHAVTSQGTTVPLTITDGCGAWSTFVGGGAGAF